MSAQNWPIVQRDSEFAQIRAALAGQANTHGIVLFGDAGVGKTTLARLATQSLPNPVRWVVGTKAAGELALGAFAHLVGESSARDPIALLASVRHVLLAEPHIALGVDDAHLLDGLSATLLHQLALDGAVPIVATIRTGAPVPDAVTSLWKDGYLRRLDLLPFTQEQCAGLIEEALGGPIEALSAGAIWKNTGGNALFLRHLVQAALEAGTLRQVHGVWQLRGRIAVTAELATFLEAHIGQMPQDVTKALRLLSLCEPLDLDTLVEIVGGEAVDHAETHGLIRVVEDEACMVQFNHPLFAEVTRRRLGVAAARRLRGELVRALGDKPIRGAAERIRLAELMRASDVAPDVELLVAAAADAIELTNVTLGEQLARAAVNRGGGLAATELLARSLMWQGRAVEADKYLSAFDPAIMDDEQLLRWGVVRTANLRLIMRDAGAANATLDLLRSRVSQGRSRVVVDGLAAVTLAFGNRLAESVELAQQIVNNPDAPPDAVAMAFVAGSLTLGLMGRSNDLAALAERGRAVAIQADGVMRYLMDVTEVQALAVAGDLDAADQRLAEMAQITSPSQYLAWGLANVMAAAVDRARGRFANVVSRMEQTVAALSNEMDIWWGYPRLVLAQSYCALGRTDAAAALVAELRTRAGEDDEVWRPELLIVEAWLAAAQGAVSRAIATAIDAADLAGRYGQHAIEIQALHDAVRFGDRTVLQRLVDVADTVDGHLATAYAAHAKALLNHDASAVYSAAQQFEQIGTLLSAADAAAQAAAMSTASSKRRQGVEAAATAERIAAECGGIRTPALIAAAEPLPLSPREREIANLVAAEMTNRQIAEQLSLSTRTVEGHIYRACVKLDVPDREALATFFRPTTA